MLEDRQLPVFLLLLPLKVQSQDCRVEHLGKLRPFVDLFRRWDRAVLVVERCRDFGFEEFLLLLCHTVGASPAFPALCSRKPIYYFSLYILYAKVKGYFTISKEGGENARFV